MKKNLAPALIFFLLIAYTSKMCIAQRQQPFQPVHGGRFMGESNEFSPDPYVNYYWSDVKNYDSLQYFIKTTSDFETIPSAKASIKKNVISITGDVTIRMDFGAVFAAWPEFDCDNLAADITMSISEYNEPAIVNEGAQHPEKTIAPKKYGRAYRLELNDQLYEGVRYVWLHIKNVKKPFTIKNPRLICQIKPVNYLGSFETNDEELNKIWYTGAYTVRLNLLQDYLGAILMERSDRHSWTGDAYPSQAASMVAFGNFDFIKKNILYTSKSDNGIAGYSLYWILSLIDYYKYSFDTLFVKENIDQLRKRLDISYTNFDKPSKLHFMGWDERLGAGFERPDIQESVFTYQNLTLETWYKVVSVLSDIHEVELARKYQHAYNEKKQQILPYAHQWGIHAMAKALNAGLKNDLNISSAAIDLYNNRLMRLSYSPFNQYFIIQSMASAELIEKAITSIRDCWGGQLKYGATTFFEVYRPSWNDALQPNDAPPNNQCGYTSLTHPWSAGVTRWLSDYVLGIRPIAPGFKQTAIMPFLDKHITFVKGSVPTPYGVIYSSFDLNSGNINVSIPKMIESTQIGIPLSGKNIISLNINGKDFPIDSLHPSENGEHLILKNIKPGTYKIQVGYSGTLNEVAEESPITYSINQFTTDSVTSGNWKNVYGYDGYYIPTEKSGSQYEQLPPYITNIKLTGNGYFVWDKKFNSNALRVDGEKKSLIALKTNDPKPTQQSFTVDINASKDSIYTISLYFLDADASGRRTAIEIFDLNTLEIISPVQIVKNYETGKYISFNAKGSVRIRINHVRGPNAVLSGLFFDPYAKVN